MSREGFIRRSTILPSNSHHRSKRQETEIARRTKGRITPGSGNQKIKGDVRIKGIARIEAKTTKHKSFTVTLDMYRKIEEAALASQELPIIVIEFNNGFGKKVAELAVVPTYILDQLG